MRVQAGVAQTIIDEIKESIHRNINFMDERGVIIASTDPGRIGSTHSGAQRLLEQRLKVLVISGNEETAGARAGINLPIEVGGETIGVIGITGDPAEVNDLGLVVKKMTELMISTIRQQEIRNGLEIARFNFLEQWLFPDHTTNWAEKQSFLQQADLLDVSLDVPRIAAVCELLPEQGASGAREQQPGTDRAADILSHLRLLTADNPQTICASVNSRIFVLFAESDAERVRSIIRRMRTELRSFFSLEMLCGISSAATDYRMVWRCYKEALAACRIAASVGRPVIVYDLLLPEYLAQAFPRELLSALQEQVFARCSEQEMREMLDTLALYYKHDGSFSGAAAELYVHPNTFAYRLSKIREKTGLNPRNPRESLPLFLISACDSLALLAEEDTAAP